MNNQIKYLNIMISYTSEQSHAHTIYRDDSNMNPVYTKYPVEYWKDKLFDKYFLYNDDYIILGTIQLYLNYNYKKDDLTELFSHELMHMLKRFKKKIDVYLDEEIYNSNISSLMVLKDFDKIINDREISCNTYYLLLNIMYYCNIDEIDCYKENIKHDYELFNSDPNKDDIIRKYNISAFIKASPHLKIYYDIIQIISMLEKYSSVNKQEIYNEFLKNTNFYNDNNGFRSFD